MRNNAFHSTYLQDRAGFATITPTAACEAGSFASLTLTYTAGYFGIDDTGCIKIVHRFASDMGKMQLSDPTGWNYVTAEASNGAVLELRYDQKGNIRPWDKTLSIRVQRGFLREGDQIVVRIGDTRQGSPGIRIQTFTEPTFEFKVLVDAFATYNFVPLPIQPTIPVVAGPPVLYKATLVFNQALYQRPGYDSLKDFAPIVLIGGVSNVMVVPPNSTANSALDVIAAAKAKPGHLTFSSGGSGTSHHLSGVLFGQMTGTELLHVPYKGAPQGIVAVMSGEVNMGFFNMPTVINQIKSGRLKALAVTSLERSTLMPNVPTLDASGVKGYEVNTWFGFIAPAGTPADVVSRLHAQIGKILAQPAIKENLASQGFDLAPLQAPSAFTTLIRNDLAKWPSIIKAAGAKVD